MPPWSGGVTLLSGAEAREDIGDHLARICGVHDRADHGDPRDTGGRERGDVGDAHVPDGDDGQARGRDERPIDPNLPSGTEGRAMWGGKARFEKVERAAVDPLRGGRP